MIKALFVRTIYFFFEQMLTLMRLSVSLENNNYVIKSVSRLRGQMPNWSRLCLSTLSIRYGRMNLKKMAKLSTLIKRSDAQKNQNHTLKCVVILRGQRSKLVNIVFVQTLTSKASVYFLLDLKILDVECCYLVHCHSIV